jgi:hypothetical protein
MVSLELNGGRKQFNRLARAQQSDASYNPTARIGALLHTGGPPPDIRQTGDFLHWLHGTDAMRVQAGAGAPTGKLQPNHKESP